MRIRHRDIARIHELVQMMEEQLAAFDRHRDHRAAFLRVYTRMTRRVQERLAGGFFLDPAWMEQVALRFAHYYFAALEGFDRGGPCPPAWQVAFAAARSGHTSVLQDVLLGINAHINNDLPQTLADQLAGSDWPHLDRLLRRRFDHDQINRILHELVPIVEDEVARHYGRLIRLLGWLLGDLDTLLATYGLKYYRDEVWHKAMALLAARPGAERERVRGWIEHDALSLARRIEQAGAPPWARGLMRLARRLRLW